MDAHQILTESCIKSLLTRERYYRDSSQWQKLRDSFHPDVSKTSINISWFNGNADEFVSRSQDMVKGGMVVNHTVSPTEVEVVGSKAFTVSPGFITSRFSRDGSEYELVSNCRFISRLERLDSPGDFNWKMLTLEAIYIDDMIRSVVPMSTGLDISAMGSFPRKSYRFLAWLLSQNGLQVSEKMPGTDDEKGVKVFLEQHMLWLKS